MKPRTVKRFEYRGKIIKIQDMGEGAIAPRYWYVLESGFADLGGNSIYEAIKTAQRDIDSVEGW